MKTKRGSAFRFDFDEDRLVDSVVRKVVAKLAPLLAGKAKLEPDQPAMQTLQSFCAANDLGVTFVRNEIRAGRLKVRKAGKLTMVDAEAAREWRASLPSGLGPAPPLGKKQPNGKEGDQPRA
jgi:hypothetical protein